MARRPIEVAEQSLGHADDVRQRARFALPDVVRLSPGLVWDVSSGARRRVPCERTSTAGHRALRLVPHSVGDASFSEMPVNEIEASVTDLIQAWNAGNTFAGERLFSRVYADLHAMARRLHRQTGDRGDATLDTTALVHELYLRLSGAGELRVENRAHFFAIAVRASRQIVMNYARDAQALKRGGDVVIDSLDAAADAPQPAAITDHLPERASALESALQRLEQLHPRPCRVVECRYFGGLSIPDTALTLGISEATVKRDWVLAQAWLHRELRDMELTR